MTARVPSQVSNEGDVLYVLPRGFRGAIAAKSWRLRAEPALKKVWAYLHPLLYAIASKLISFLSAEAAESSVA